MAQRKAEGVHVGRPRVMDEAVRARVFALRSEGLTMGKIAERLNVEGTATAHGGRKWYASTVKRVLDAQELVED